MKEEILIPATTDYPKIHDTDLLLHKAEWDVYIQQFEHHAEQYMAYPLPAHTELRILTISDTHGRVFNTNVMDFIRNRCVISDVILLLGDFSSSDLERICMAVPYKKTFGILGDHDLKQIYQKFGIQQLGQKIIEIKGFRLGGIDGSIKHQDSLSHALLSHTESIEIAKEMEPAHILFSHDIPYYSESEEKIANQGLMGISTYIYENHVPLNIHGHLHKQTKLYLPNDCLCLGVYFAAFIQIVDGIPMISHFHLK